MARGVTYAVYVFCVNVVFTLVSYVNPFHLADTTPIFSDMGMINTTVSNISGITSAGQIGLYGLLMTFGSIFDLMISLLLGPLKLTPLIMNAIGFDLFITWVVTSVVWVSYGILMFQLITGRTLEAVS